MALGRKKRVFHTKERQRRFLVRRALQTGVGCVALIFLLTVVWYGTRLSALQVAEITVTGSETIPTDRIIDRVDTLLAGSHYGVVPYRFFFGVPINNITAVIEEMPRIADARVTRQGAMLSVAVTEHSPEMLWCGVATSSECYYVDDAGVAYERAPELSGGTLMRFAVAGTEPKEGESLLDSRIRATLIDVARAMEERHEFKVSRIEYAENGDVTLSLSGGGVVLVSTEDDLGTTYENLASILSSEEFTHLRPGNFERIDLRFGDKVFVQEEPVVATTTASTTLPVE